MSSNIKEIVSAELGNPNTHHKISLFNDIICILSYFIHCKVNKLSLYCSDILIIRSYVIKRKFINIT